MTTKERAHGRWRDILPALGIAAEYLDGKPHPCPACGGRDRFTFYDDTGDGGYFCRNIGPCGPGFDGFKLLMKARSWDFARAAREVDKVLGGPITEHPKTEAMRILGRPPDWEYMCRLWADGRSISDNDPVARYLRKRMLMGPYPDALRFVPSMHHKPTMTCHYGMIARFTDSEGELATIHRTYISTTCDRPHIDPHKMFVAGKLPRCGAVRLSPLSDRLGIAEGIETALSASVTHDGMPVWAALTAPMLSKWYPPKGTKEVVIFGDNDPNLAGRAAAEKLAGRLHCKVEIKMPPPEFKDWNDVLTRRSNHVTAKSA
jgi:putative DNA primase/helicase